MKNSRSSVMLGAKERQVWLDYLRVLGMVFIVWGHCSPTHMSAFAYAFDVQLFFFASGYLQKQQKTDWNIFVKKQWSSLLLPMFLICTINLLLSYLLGRRDIATFPMSCVLILGGFHSLNGISGLGTMWFVYSLILIKVIFNRCITSKKLIFLLTGVCLSATVWLGNQDYCFSNAWIDTLLAIPFYSIGFLCARYNKQIERFTTIYSLSFRIVLIIIIACVLYFVSLYNGCVYMFSGKYGNNFLLFLLASSLGIIMMIILSKGINIFPKQIALLANGTILILGFQTYFYQTLQSILLKCGISAELWLYDFLTLLGSACIVLAFYPISITVKKFFPVLMGMRKL